MIRAIRIANWRAYESLELDLDRPVVFLVAPNGVGKSSLVEAVRWGLLGVPDDRKLGRAVRAGRDTATVRLVVRLPGPGDVEVTRELKRSGATKFHASVGGNVIDEGRYRVLIADAWAADTGLLDALIFGPAQHGKSTGFPIRDHLADILGITQLLDAAATIKARRKEIEQRIESLRDDLSGTAEAIVHAEEAASALEAEVEIAGSARAAAADQLRGVRALHATATAWTQYRTAAQEYEEHVRGLVQKMSSVLELGGRRPDEALIEAERDANAQLEARVRAANDARVQAAGSVSAAELLAGDVGRCPTCLRPLTSQERAAALAAHEHDRAQSGQEVDAGEREADAARARLRAVTGFRDAFSRLRPPDEPDVPDPGPQGLVLEQAEQVHDETTERFAALNAQLALARQDLASLRKAAADQAALVAAEREDLVLGMTERALVAAARAYTTHRVEPLTAEIGRRWKLLFGAEGLQLDSDGVLTLRNGDVDLALTEFSGGERSTALLVTRLLLAASATRLQTMWFDEPLEHLDRRRRAAVAQTIVRAAQLGAVGQVVITTYEEEIARRLEATAPEAVQLTYARKGGPTQT